MDREVKYCKRTTYPRDNSRWAKWERAERIWMCIPSATDTCNLMSKYAPQRKGVAQAQIWIPRIKAELLLLQMSGTMKANSSRLLLKEMAESVSRPTVRIHSKVKITDLLLYVDHQMYHSRWTSRFSITNSNPSLQGDQCWTCQVLALWPRIRSRFTSRILLKTQDNPTSPSNSCQDSSSRSVHRWTTLITIRCQGRASHLRRSKWWTELTKYSNSLKERRKG